MVLYGAAGILRCGGGGGGFLHVKENLGKMLNGPRAFTSAQKKVVKFGAGEMCANAVAGMQQAAMEERCLADIVMAAQGVRRPVGLEMRLRALSAIRRQYVIIGVYHVGQRLVIDGAH